jgi:hypothetical protein
MAKSVKVDVNIEDFTKVLRRYVVASKKDVATAVRDKAGDVAFMGAKNTKKADKGQIPPLASGLYNALVAADPKKVGGDFGFAAQRAQEKIKKKFGAGPFPKGKNNAKAAAYLRNRRAGAASYSKSLWLKMARELGKKVAKLRSDKIKNTEVRQDNMSGFSNVPSVTLRIKGVDQKHASEVLEPAMQAAVDDVSKDMLRYIKRKFEENAGLRKRKSKN